jgi:hypothetical protein
MYGLPAPAGNNNCVEHGIGMIGCNNRGSAQGVQRKTAEEPLSEKE